MPEWLFPGVFVEELPFRAKPIEGVSTSTAGLVGPTRFGPVGGAPPLVTSFPEFERIYGGLEDLAPGGAAPIANYVAHAARGFFEEGGRRLHVARVFAPGAEGDGCARWTSASDPTEPAVTLRARYPGAAGNVSVTVTVNLGGNTRQGAGPEGAALHDVASFDTVLVLPQADDTVRACWIEPAPDGDDATNRRLRTADPTAPALTADDVRDARVLTMDVRVHEADASADIAWIGLQLDPRRTTSLSTTFAPQPPDAAHPHAPIVFEAAGLANGAAVAEAFLSLRNADGRSLLEMLSEQFSLGAPPLDDARRSSAIVLAGGTDGAVPGADDYAGQEASDDGSVLPTGLAAVATIPEVCIVAAPGVTAAGAPAALGPAVNALLVAHVEHARYRMAVLDSMEGASPHDVQIQKSSVSTSRAALYYPWLAVGDPNAGTTRTRLLPPSGFVAGIYARVDVERGVHKAPGNELVRQAAGVERAIDAVTSEALNAAGINVIRAFDGRGIRVWGARTSSADAEFKYVNVRRYCLYLERSIDRGLQWAVFEGNGPALWVAVRVAIEDFLHREFRVGTLAGRTPDEAFFVRCDATTMTQEDLDAGRLIAVVGLAPLRPAEFVIVRIGVWTRNKDD